MRLSSRWANILADPFKVRPDSESLLDSRLPDLKFLSTFAVHGSFVQFLAIASSRYPQLADKENAVNVCDGGVSKRQTR